jgi:hypothetical protein
MRRVSPVLVLLAALSVPCAASALEATLRRAPDMRESWGASTTATIRYWNICTGWAYGWSGLAANETFGSEFEVGPGCNLVATSVFWFSGYGSGYGFTGTISIKPDCSSAPLASQPHLPTTGWTTQLWGIPLPDKFTVSIKMAPSPFANPGVIASDHPAAGPTGPPPLGTCYPANRPPHSFDYGISNALCGADSTFFDGAGAVEFFIDSYVKCPTPVQQSSWGRIKVLYQ